MNRALIHTWLANYGGCAHAAQTPAVICIVAGAIQVGSVHVSIFLLGRFLAEVGVGPCVTIVPVYQSKIAPPASLGFVVGSHCMVIVTSYVGCVDWIRMLLPGQRAISVSFHTRCSMFTPSVPSPLHIFMPSPRYGLSTSSRCYSAAP